MIIQKLPISSALYNVWAQLPLAYMVRRFVWTLGLEHKPWATGVAKGHTSTIHTNLCSMNIPLE
jgi:hypothetical protein